MDIIWAFQILVFGGNVVQTFLILPLMIFFNQLQDPKMSVVCLQYLRSVKLCLVFLITAIIGIEGPIQMIILLYWILMLFIYVKHY